MKQTPGSAPQLLIQEVRGLRICISHELLAMLMLLVHGPHGTVLSAKFDLVASLAPLVQAPWQGPCGPLFSWPNLPLQLIDIKHFPICSSPSADTPDPLRLELLLLGMSLPLFTAL